MLGGSVSIDVVFLGVGVGNLVFFFDRNFRR